MAVKKLGIVVYGACKKRDGFWEAWLDKAKELVRMIGYAPTHAGIMGTSLSANIRTLRRSEGKMRQVIADGEPVQSLSVYAMPVDFRTESDHLCWLHLADNNWYLNKQFEKYAYCEMNLDECSREIVETVKNVLMEFIEIEQCEIFTMEKSQTPYNYVFKGMGEDISRYPTLEILWRTDKHSLACR